MRINSIKLFMMTDLLTLDSFNFTDIFIVHLNLIEQLIMNCNNETQQQQQKQ